MCDPINRNRRQRSEQTVEGKQNPRRCIAVDSKNLEYSTDQVRVERRFPRAGAGMVAVRIAETLAQGERTADPSHLKAESEMIFDGAHPILVQRANQHDLNQK